MESSLVLIAGGVFFLAGMVKGISGMGLPTFSIALLGLFMPPATAATLVLLPSLLTNLAQCVGPHTLALVRRLWPLWLGVAVATVYSPLPELGHATTTTRWVLGLVLMAYGIWGLARPTLPRWGRHTLWAGGLAGLLSGMVTAATGVFVMPLVPYLQALRLEKDMFIQALGLSFLMATLALAVRLSTASATIGTAVPPVAHAIALLTAGAGVWLGARLRGRLPVLVFQRALYAVFIALGSVMLSRAL